MRFSGKKHQETICLQSFLPNASLGAVVFTQNLGKPHAPLLIHHGDLVQLYWTVFCERIRSPAIQFLPAGTSEKEGETSAWKTWDPQIIRNSFIHKEPLVFVKTYSLDRVSQRSVGHIFGKCLLFLNSGNWKFHFGSGPSYSNLSHEKGKKRRLYLYVYR